MSFGAKLRASRDRYDRVTGHFTPIKQQFVPLAKMCIEQAAKPDPLLPTRLRHKICHVLRSDGWILEKMTTYWQDEFNPGRERTSGGEYKQWKRIKREIDPHEYVAKFKALRAAQGWVEDTRGI